ncbi:LacI family transcriptional regulator [Cohnella cholangitidis]|uniref:LacI family transcriptional regulator n=1 Tax=Cohnella cholangitidis TaxID=2598458 RepID=A0A7G5C0V9_9BACL|nr:LacI family transcriptional regulator [Cohnella cholangitidis]
MENVCVKMEDIAKQANVSKSAVSLALNGKPGISEDTRERVIRIAQESGYIAKRRAAPAQERPLSSLLFLVCANSGIVLEQYYQQPFFRELIHYIEERCRSKGYSLQFATLNTESLEQNVKSLSEDNRNSGVILLGTNLGRQQIVSIAEHLPQIVVLDTNFETLPIPFVEINNVMGAYQAGSYLYEIGHREIGYVASNVRIHNFNSRQRGFMSALEDRELAIPDNRIFSVAPTILYSQESMREQLQHYLQENGRLPTALFCECDYIAISAMKTLNELGFRVPEDVSVIGFDNITESMVVTPELTTIHVEKEKMAQVAVDMLIELIHEGLNTTTKTTIDTKFIERLSCRAPINHSK